MLTMKTLLGIALGMLVVSQAGAQTELPPPYLRDRGTGIRTSIFGTYVRPGEILVSPFFEYYLDNDYEYKPSELGVPGNIDYRGRFRGTETLLFISYGVTDWLAVELEPAVMRATLEKAPSDGSALPAKLTEPWGVGDLQAQLDFRLLREQAHRPEVFSYLEVVFPTPGDRVLTGTSDWEFKGGAGIARGFGWGTMTLRGAAAYVRAERAFEVGEWAVEYLRRVSPTWRIYAGVEGTQDEVELIGEVQWHLGNYVFFRFNSAVGLTSKATDLAPDIGVVFSLPTR